MKYIVWSVIYKMTKDTLTSNERNLFRIAGIVKTEMLIEEAEYNRNKKWWDRKKFDLNVFTSGFKAGMNYFKRLQAGDFNLEDEDYDKDDK